MQNCKGYIIEQLMITLIILSVLLPITITNTEIMIRNMKADPAFQDEINIAQLRHILNCSENFITNGSLLQFEYHLEQYELVLSNRRLILHPGTQIFLSDIDQIVFSSRNNVIYMDYIRDTNIYSRSLCHE